MHVLKKHKPINAICETGSYTNSLLQLFDTQLTRTASAFYHLLTITMNPPKRQHNTMKLFPEIHNISSSESLNYKNNIAMQVSTKRKVTLYFSWRAGFSATTPSASPTRPLEYGRVHSSHHSCWSLEAAD